jgi:hypothetical protein
MMVIQMTVTQQMKHESTLPETTASRGGVNDTSMPVLHASG